jgi:hypothetical protein
MGGKNHQPCGRYLVNSTNMSRYMSLAMSEIELANVALEDLLLAELRDEIGNSEPIVLHLSHSSEHLHSMLGAMVALEHQMADEHYVDLPPMKTINLIQLGRNMAEEGQHRSESSWQKIAIMMKEQGFASVLRHHKDTANRIIGLTNALQSRVSDAGELARQGNLTLALEQNLGDNFKPEFAQVYTAWAEFQQEFLASSLISTEVWYAFNRTGSLIKTTSASAMVA